eukprot:gnl/TRDRNA2_/TRDRNA2_187876_c0_seq1.p1 gnl/TRDRNA2_/TRDRNA2_187876_c0~~gnl/TRDRNA2_/TRDRNA2_187876_c0_seq1.p1  ORF type:complete len:231 (+),score=75.64 gnl/TRDRNA2_/TRDRNA2_187876_c0_seq1:90-782(+)
MGNVCTERQKETPIPPSRAKEAAKAKSEKKKDDKPQLVQTANGATKEEKPAPAPEVTPAPAPEKEAAPAPAPEKEAAPAPAPEKEPEPAAPAAEEAKEEEAEPEKPAPLEAFKVADENNDGKLSMEEAAVVGVTEEQFKAMDADGDGKIDEEEWKAAQAKEERKVDPHDGRAYTFNELSAFYRGMYTKKQIEDYWKKNCKPMTGSPASAKKSPKPNKKKAAEGPPPSPKS